MKTFVKLSFAVLTMTFSSAVRAQIPAANPLNFHLTFTNNSASDGTLTNDSEILPIIEFHHTAITVVIEHLARAAGINYLIEPHLMQRWSGSAEPVISFRLTNITAKEVLERLLRLRNLALVEDPVSNIAFIVHASQITNTIFTSLPSMATNSSYFHTNDLIPLIQFNDVPITTAIENLARRDNIRYLIDPKLSELGSSIVSDPMPEPILSLRLENITCWNVLNRMLNIRKLVLIDDPATHVARITRSDSPEPVVDASLLEMPTNNLVPLTNGIIPVIQFEDTALDVILEVLIRESSLHVTLDPRIQGTIDPRKGWLNHMPVLSLRWEGITPKQALIALCKNYDLIIVKDSANDLIRIKPKEIK